MDYTGTNYQIPEDEYYRQISVNNTNIIICQNCGVINHISLNWYGGFRGLIFCMGCGQEI